MTTEHDTVVFLGPSLPVAEASSILAARYEPPARLGSVYELIGSEVETILLVDGVFHNEPSVWQREIDAALQAGITVFGASSMGALRAAELHRFGMIGHGVVFDWYHQGVIDGDDEVALLHGDADAGHRPLSEPMVNIRYTLERAVEAGVIPGACLARIVGLAKRVFYPQRSFARLVADVRADPELAAFAGPLERYVATERVDLKRRDACSLLALVADLRRSGDTATVAELARRDPFVVRDRHGHARLADAWRHHGQRYRKLEHEGRWWTLGELAVEAGTEPVEVPNLGGAGSITLVPAVRRQLVADRTLRAIAVEHARVHELVAPARYLERVTARLAAEVEIASWIRACRITRPELQERLAAEATVAWFADELPPEVARMTADWTDPMAGGPDATSEVGRYLRVFASHAERLACRRVALAALLEENDHEIEAIPLAEWSALLEDAA